MQVLNFVVSFVVIAVMFALLFKWMPDADVAWRDVALGAVGSRPLRNRPLCDRRLHRQANPPMGPRPRLSWF